MGNIFISYRRDDTSAIAERICDHLTERFGDRRVFQDVVDIPQGSSWSDEIDAAIGSSDTVLVIIGPNWLTATKDGGRRLDDPSDVLRQEIVRALARPGISVVPVLIDDAAMPAPDDLPDDLKPLTGRQARTIRGGEHFHRDVAALANAIGPPAITRRRWFVPTAAATTALALVALVLVITNTTGDSDTAAPAATIGTTAVATPADPTAATIDREADPTATTTTSTSTTSTTLAPVDDNAAGYETEPLTGAFNVAVLGFVATPADERAITLEATNAAKDLVQYLEDRLAEPDNSGPSVPHVDVGFFAPPEPGSPEATDVQLLADRLNADVVIGGTLRSTEPRGSSFDPTFAVRTDSTRRLLGLAGTYGLGAPTTFARGFIDPAVRLELRATLERRSCILVHLVLGLSYYRATDYDGATASFQRAIAADSCPAAPAAAASSGSEGQEIAYLYLGSLALLANDQAAADGWYDRALAIDPGYARAMFGKAEVEFQRARLATCDGSADVSRLETALDMYDDAFEAYRAGLSNGQQEVPYLATQGHLQIGRARLCLGLHDPASLAVASRELNEVITDFLKAPEDRQAQLADAAAEAYAGLGYLELTKPDGPDFDTALTQIDRALELNPASERAAVFHALRAFVNTGLGRSADAANDCAGSNGQQCPLRDADDFLHGYTEPLALAATGPPSITGRLIIACLLVVIGTTLTRLSRRPRAP